MYIYIYTYVLVVSVDSSYYIVRLEVGPGLRMLPLGPMMGCADPHGSGWTAGKRFGEQQLLWVPRSITFWLGILHSFPTYFIISAIWQQWHVTFPCFSWLLRRGIRVNQSKKWCLHGKLLIWEDTLRRRLVGMAQSHQIHTVYVHHATSYVVIIVILHYYHD